MLLNCQLSLAQTDSMEIKNLPLDSFLIESDKDEFIDNMGSLKVLDTLIFFEFAEKIDSTKSWELVGLQIKSSAIGGIPEEAQVPKIDLFKPINNTISINSGLIFDLFKLNESNNPKDFKGLGFQGVFGSSYSWTPFYYREYLILKKCDGYIGSQISYERTVQYYFIQKE